MLDEVGRTRTLRVPPGRMCGEQDLDPIWFWVQADPGSSSLQITAAVTANAYRVRRHHPDMARHPWLERASPATSSSAGPNRLLAAINVEGK
jgi:hypothetical protein